MRNKFTVHTSTVLLWLSTFICQLSTFAQGTAFTYQGRLNVNGSPANGTYDFRFRLSSDSQGNNYIGSPVLADGKTVAEGLFTVTLDFGPVFNGSNVWLEVDVRTNGGPGYSALAPLQALTPAPMALYALTPAGPQGPAGPKGDSPARLAHKVRQELRHSVCVEAMPFTSTALSASASPTPLRH